MKWLIVILASVLICAALPAAAKNVPTIEYNYYPVRVNRPAEVVSATGLNRPANLTDSSKPSRTDWRIDYTFNSVRKYGNNCQVSTYDIKAVCVITLPDYKSDDALLAYRLKSYTERLKVHELRHCEIVGEHADKFEDWLDSIRYYNCGEVMNSVRRQYNIFMRECERANLNYDRDTNYGQRDGADLNLLLSDLKDEAADGKEKAAEAGDDNNPAAAKEQKELKNDIETRPEPMSNYYQDKDGVWRNDGNMP